MISYTALTKQNTIPRDRPKQGQSRFVKKVIIIQYGYRECGIRVRVLPQHLRMKPASVGAALLHEALLHVFCCINNDTAKEGTQRSKKCQKNLRWAGNAVPVAWQRLLPTLAMLRHSSRYSPEAVDELPS